MNDHGLRRNVHCVAYVALRIRLNLYKRGFKIYDLLVSIRFVLVELFYGGHLHTIATNVDIAPELVERLHRTTSVHMIALIAAEQKYCLRGP